ncbi:MAG TPA: hypothetical protein VNO24_29260 [Blastocatellia bacterium]|nr:hypothetical protein [Blastocatellia bacterium]
MDIDRRGFLAALGGAVAIEAMSSEALADALEHHMIERLDQAAGARSSCRCAIESDDGTPLPTRYRIGLRVGRIR